MSDYVDGDVNEVDERDEVSADTAVAVLTYLAKALADEPEAVSVKVEDSAKGVKLSLAVAPGDMGRIIGRRGRTAQALRTLVGAAGARDGVATFVDIVD